MQCDICAAISFASAVTGHQGRWEKGNRTELVWEIGVLSSLLFLLSFLEFAVRVEQFAVARIVPDFIVPHASRSD